MNTENTLRGHCHCGCVTITLPSAPEKCTICNCSLCRRVGAVWAYYKVGSIKIDGHPEHTEGYVQGDKVLTTVRCKTCGIVTHWEPIGEGDRMAANLRNFPLAVMEGVEKRRFDGADSWSFVDEAGTPHSAAWPF
jgi:hypothetical protein